MKGFIAPPPPLPPINSTQADIARAHAAAKIVEHYPLWKQLNISRLGVASQVLKMDKFIQAVVAWSNQPSPDPMLLQQIKP